MLLTRILHTYNYVQLLRIAYMHTFFQIYTWFSLSLTNDSNIRPHPFAVEPHSLPLYLSLLLQHSPGGPGRPSKPSFPSFPSVPGGPCSPFCPEAPPTPLGPTGPVSPSMGGGGGVTLYNIHQLSIIRINQEATFGQK